MIPPSASLRSKEREYSQDEKTFEEKNFLSSLFSSNRVENLSPIMVSFSPMKRKVLFFFLRYFFALTEERGKINRWKEHTLPQS